MSMGNPHAVFWVENDVWSYDLEKFGPLLENHPIFPERCNITIAQVTSPTAMTTRTWERGRPHARLWFRRLLGCGERRPHRAYGRKVTINVASAIPPGSLELEWRLDNHVVMTGPATWEWSGTVDPVTGAWQADEAVAV